MIGVLIRNKIAKYSWYVLRWSLGLSAKQDPYIWAYMAHPEGYVVHDRNTIEREMGFKAECIMFRREDVEDPRLKAPNTKVHAMQEGGYL